jgi:TrwC relaxase/AAA domain
MNFRKIAAASKGKLLLRYFTEDTPEPIHRGGLIPAGRQLDEGGRLTAYYTGRDSRATWRPDMPAALARAAGIDPHRMPRDGEMSRLFEGKRADNGEAWSKHKRKLSGFDLVFSPHKSVTLAAEFAATPAESAAIWNAIDRANDRAMRYVAQVLGWARRGAGGEDGADPGAVGWISFRHHTARPTLPIQDGPRGATYLTDAPVAGDPHAHIHNFLMNLVVTAQGRIGSLDSRALTDARVKEFGATFQAVLADEMRRIGARISYDASEQAFVLDAIPEAVSKAFSKGRRQILHKAKAYAKDQGLNWDNLAGEEKMDILRDAGAEGRLGKLKNDERRLWREQAREMAWEHRTVMEGIEHERLGDRERFDRAYRFAARHLAQEFHTAAVISHEKLGMYAARGLIGVGIAGGSEDIKRVVELLEERGIRLKGEQVALVVGMFDGQVRATNTAQIRIEQSLAERARAIARDKRGALLVAAIEQAIAGAGIDFTGEQRAAIHALGRGGGLTMLTGVAGAGKTTLLEALVAAWHADTRFSQRGREVIGSALAWRQADALKDAGLSRTYALAPLLRMIETGEFQPDQNTVLVLDEVSQIGPRPLLKLLELQACTGMTIKMLGDREQAQAIEAGDAIEILRRALPPEALPELLTTMRQASKRGREIAGLFRDGEAARALALKRQDGHAMLVGGDRDQVVARIAELYIARRDMLMAGGAKRGITVSAPTNEDVAEISQAIRQRLKERGEIDNAEIVYQAIDQEGRTYDLPIATGDRVRLYRRTWGIVGGRAQHVGDNGDIVEVLGQTGEGLRLRTKDGRVAEVEWRRFNDDQTGRLLLGFGHALTITAAQGITSDEHINALPRGTSGVTAFTAYTAESRSRGTTWTLVSEAAVYEAERYRQALGDITPITSDDLWARVAEDMSEKPYKGLGIDLLGATRSDREKAIDTFIATHHAMETAQLEDPGWGRRAMARVRAIAVNENLARHLTGLDHAIQQNAAELRDTLEAMAAASHLRALRAEAAAAKHNLDQVAQEAGPSRSPSIGPG